MHRLIDKLAAKIVLIAGILVCAGGALIGSASAQVFRVDLSGTFQNVFGPGTLIAPGTAFSGSFLVNTDAASVLHDNVSGLNLTGYADAAISGLSITAGGITFTNINDRLSGGPAAVFFSQDLANGAAPGIDMLLTSGANALFIGGIGCGSTCSFSNLLELNASDGSSYIGSVSAFVTLIFAGTPKASNCNGVSVSALSNKYGTLDAAVAALGFPNVPALKTAIKKFCAR